MNNKENTSIKNLWPKPARRSLAASSDLRLFYEAMSYIKKYEFISKKQLKNELSSRVKGLKFVKNVSGTGIENLIKELKSFGWIVALKQGSVERSELGLYILTPEGQKVLSTYTVNKREFLKILIKKMHKQYVIPGWFIHRLWSLNPQGQGQIIIPAPIKKWNPSSREWSDNEWDDELRDEVLKSYHIIQKMAPDSFNIPSDIWIENVKTAWNRLSRAQKRKDVETAKFAPRRRLTLAMKEAAVGLLFNNKFFGNDRSDFKLSKPPIAPRTYMAWCPRLEELELIIYSDYNSVIPGRIIVPVSVFKNRDENQDYEFVDVENPEKNSLALHRPNLNKFDKIFAITLFRVYQEIYLKTKSLYVSIQNVRDEVCRRLRISSSYFEDFLAKLSEDSLNGDVDYTISIETDVREDQKSAHQLERRPVNINGKFCSLIAMTKQIKK